MEDAIDEIFSPLDNYYPGSRRKRREAPKPAAVDRVGGWEDRSVTKAIHGKERPMYTIGALASAVNKSEKSVRLWTTRGYIPQAPYRLPSVRGADGVVRMGRRLYAKEMIEAAVGSFEKRGLLDSPRIEWSRHQDLTNELLESWREIQQQIADSNL